MITLPPLPYAKDALTPHISERTVSFHYEKHHQGYVTNLNNLIQGTSYEGLSLEDIIQKSANHQEDSSIFNNAAQVWNHTFYWNSMCENGSKISDSPLLDKINSSFGSIDELIGAMKQAALTQFGSGWAWLVYTKDGKLAIEKTSNAQCPLITSSIPLLTIDVWEHAYYLDFQNLRAAYIEAFFSHLVNWEFANQNLIAALV